MYINTLLPHIYFIHARGKERKRGVLLLFKKFSLLCVRNIYFTLEEYTVIQLDHSYDDSRDYYWKPGNIV